MDQEFKDNLKKNLTTGNTQAVTKLVNTYLSSSDKANKGKQVVELIALYMEMKNTIDQRYEKSLDELIRNLKKTTPIENKIDTLLKKDR